MSIVVIQTQISLTDFYIELDGRIVLGSIPAGTNLETDKFIGLVLIVQKISWFETETR